MLRHPDRGSATVGAIAAILFTLLLVFAVLEVAFILYARNVLMSSAHEGARAAIELGRSPEDAAGVAEGTVVGAASGLVGALDVDTTVTTSSGASVVTVVVRGKVRGLGVLPVAVPIAARATSTRHTTVE